MTRCVTVPAAGSMTKRLTSPHEPSEQLALAPMVNSDASATTAFPSGRPSCATVIADQRFPHVQAGDNPASSLACVRASTGYVRADFIRGGGGRTSARRRLRGPDRPVARAGYGATDSLTCREPPRATNG